MFVETQEKLCQEPFFNFNVAYSASTKAGYYCDEIVFFILPLILFIFVLLKYLKCS